MKCHLVGRITFVLPIINPEKEPLCVSVARLLVDRGTLLDTGASTKMGAR